MRHALTWGLAATLIVSGVIFWSPSVQGLPGRITVTLGNASYSVYLASSLLIEFSGRLLVKLAGHPTIGKQVLVQTAIVLVVFLGGWLSHSVCRVADDPLVAHKIVEILVLSNSSL